MQLNSFQQRRRISQDPYLIHWLCHSHALFHRLALMLVPDSLLALRMKWLQCLEKSSGKEPKQLLTIQRVFRCVSYYLSIIRASVTII